MTTEKGSQPKCALVFVPGFVPGYRVSNGWTLFDEFLQLLRADRELLGETDAGSATGYSVRNSEFCCDVFAVSWNDRLDRLSAKPALFRVGRTIALMVTSMAPSLRQIFSSSRAFALQTLATGAALFFFVAFWVLSIFGFHQLWFTLLAAIFAASSFALGDAADVVDAYRRYLLEARDSLRDRLRNRVVALLDKVSDAGYVSVTIVGHSFGALLAVDAIPHYKRGMIRLVTIGASFSYLNDLEPSCLSTIIECCEKSGLVTRWIDITSLDDPIAGGIEAVGSARGRVESRYIRLEHNFAEYMTGVVHEAYFTNEEVREVMREVLR